MEDSHTGVYNHRYLMYRIDAELARAKRFDLALSVIMMDIDYFKSVNDTYGHRFGDLVLKQFAQQLKRIVRKTDVIARFGGDEFVAILVDTDAAVAKTVAHKIIEDIAEHAFSNKKYSISLRVSLGLSHYPAHKVTRGMDLIDIADKYLAEAKELGGGRLVWSAHPLKEEDIYVKEDEQIAALKKKIANLARRANQSLIEAIYALAKAIEFKDRYSAKNMELSRRYAEEIAEAIGFSEREVELIRHAAILHDLGKIGVSESVLFKKGDLSSAEYEQIKNHPHIAADILRPVHFLRDVIPWVLHHHERWDGKGYPDGLKGEDIPLGSRIIAVTDAYQALVSARTYRKAYNKNKVMGILKSEAGTKFDPRIVGAFLEILKADKT